MSVENPCDIPWNGRLIGLIGTFLLAQFAWANDRGKGWKFWLSFGEASSWNSTQTKNHQQKMKKKQTVSAPLHFWWGGAPEN